MKKYLAIITLVLSFNSLATSVEIYSSSESRYISIQEFIELAPTKAHYVLGEYHYDRIIQKAQADIIQTIVIAKDRVSNFTFGWEFLLQKDQQHVSDTMDLFASGQLSAEDMMRSLFPAGSNDPTNSLKYLPVFEVTAELDGELLALNASRSTKRYITSGGLGNLPQQFEIPQMQLGSESYLERFQVAMGDGHVPPHMVQNFFEAQCYTDSIMAYTFSERSNYDLRFTAVGSFHSDYSSGYVEQLARYWDLPVVNIKIVNALETSANERAELISSHPQYGYIGDYIIFAQ